MRLWANPKGRRAQVTSRAGVALIIPQANNQARYLTVAGLLFFVLNDVAIADGFAPNAPRHNNGGVPGGE